MREGLGKGWMNEGGGCRVVTFSSGHVKARLWLHRAVSPRLLNLGAKHLSLVLKYQSGPAGMDLSFHRGSNPPRADVDGAVANPSGYFMFYL